MSNVTENEQFESQKEFDVRVEKVKRLEKAGVFPYAAKFKRTHKIAQAKELKEGAELSVCGRLISSRIMGKILFGHIYDIDAKIQVVISMDECPEGFEFYKEYIDVADFIGVTGKMFVTKAGELSVRVSKLTLLSKALRPLPEKFHGITDTDTIYRQRYLDLIANEKSRQTFRTRLAVIKTIRDYLTSNGFTEVETPILQNVASGAVARPFKTKHNALNKDYYLRIAPELYLKQVVAGGFDRVFELGKNFRNEGMDASHLQEFTMLEWYAAYWDYKDNIDFSVSMIQKIVKEVKGNLVVEYQGKKFDFTKVAYMDYTAELNHITGKDILTISFAELKKHLLSTKMFSAEDFKELHSMPALVDFVFKKKLRPSIMQPTITHNYPTYMIPLARHNDADNRIIDMFQLIVNGWEMLKAYSELVNPIAQRAEFVQQAKNRAAGDDESMDVDENFLLAMEHGMPPMSGLGLGIDRFISFLTDQPTLREVVLFPIVK